MRSQKFMAFEGLLGWAEGVVAQAESLWLAQATITDPLKEEARTGDWKNNAAVLQADKS
jgi:hypothetical protein